MRKAFALVLTAVTLVLTGVTACGTASSSVDETSPSGSTATTQMETGGTSSTTSAADPSATSGAIDVSLMDYMIMPHDYTAKAGSLSFAVRNDGQAPHTFSIRDDKNKEVATTRNLDPGQKETLQADLKSGAYVVYCAVAGHESLGMKGTLTVS